MNYYPHHIGDYLKDTAHLTMIEDGAYRRLIDLYYQHEAPLPRESRQVYRLSRASTTAERKAIDTILKEYFTLTGDGWTHRRCDAEIGKSREKSNKARKSAAKRWDSEGNANAYANASTNVMRTHSEGNAYPITNSQEPITKEEAATTPSPVARDGEADPPPLSNPENSKPSPDASPARTTQIVVLLRRNGADSRTHANSKGIAELAQMGATDVQILSALETGKQRRKDAESAQPVTAAYLVPIVQELQNPPPEKPAQEHDKWWTSNAGIDRKARELGMYARGNEDYASFKDRIFDELKTRSAGQGAQP